MICGSFAERDLQLKSGPEPLEKEINEILGSKRDTNFLTLLLSWYKKHARFVFLTCFGTVIYARARTLRKFPRKYPKIGGCWECAVYGCRPLIFDTWLNPCEWVMSYMNESCPIWMSHVAYECDGLDTWLSPSWTKRSTPYHESTSCVRFICNMTHDSQQHTALQRGLDHITSQPSSHATCPCTTASRTLSCLSKHQERDKAQVRTWSSGTQQ